MMGAVNSRDAAKEADHRHCRLLRACRERPRRRRAAEQRDELAAPHSITSSARAIGVGGWRYQSFLGMLFIASARYRIKFAHTAKYKTKAHAIAINTSQIAILANLGTCP